MVPHLQGMSMEGQPGRLCQYQTAFSAFGSCLVDLMVDPNPKFSHESNISVSEVWRHYQQP